MEYFICIIIALVASIAIGIPVIWWIDDRSKKPFKKLEDWTCREVLIFYLNMGYRYKTPRDFRKPFTCDCCDYETNTRIKKRSIYTGGLL